MNNYPYATTRIAIVVLIDQSGSMAEMHSLSNMLKSKAELVATGVNTLLTELLRHARNANGQVQDLFDVAIIGYGGDKATYLLHKGLFSCSQLDKTRSDYIIDRPGHNFLLNNTADNLMEYRRWIMPIAKGRTPMGGALKKCIGLLQRWCKQYPSAPPPMVINISDGEASDVTAEELSALADRLKNVGTEQGKTLFMNIHLDSLSLSEAIKCPSQSAPLPPHRHTRLLYDLSSTMPQEWDAAIAEMKGKEENTPPFKALCYNCAAEEILSLLHHHIDNWEQDNMIL